MTKFNKAYNSKIVSIILIAAFSLYSVLSYAPLAYSETYTLRVPIKKDYKELNGAMDSVNKKTMSRRDFIKRSIIVAPVIAILPILLTGDSDKIIRAMEDLDKYPISLDYLYGLSKKEGIAYIQGFYYAVTQGKADRSEAERFLREVFGEADLLWMREESVKVLIKLGMMGRREIKDLFYSIPDQSILGIMAVGLGEIGGKTELLDLFEQEKVLFVKGEIAIGLGKAGATKAELLELFRKEKDWYVKGQLAVALGNIGAKAELLELFGKEKEEIVRPYIVIALVSAGATKSELLELFYKEKRDIVKGEIAILLPKVGISKSELLDLFYSEETSFVKQNIAVTLANLGGKEELIEAFKKEKDLYVKRHLLYTLINAGASRREISRLVSEEEKDYFKEELTIISFRTATSKTELLELFKKEPDMSLRAEIVLALDKDTSLTETEILGLYEKEKEGYVKSALLVALNNRATQASIDYLLDLKTGGEVDSYTTGYILYEMCGYKAIEAVYKKLTLSLSKEEKEYIKDVLTSVISQIDKGLLFFNIEIDNDARFGEENLGFYFSRLKYMDTVLYAVISLSQEITSHSFPMAYNHFKERIIDKYGSFDIFRYISEEWDNALLTEFLFTLAIFDKLEESFVDTKYSPEELAGLVLPDEELENLTARPALLSKVIFNITGFEDKRLKDAFIDRIVSLAEKSLDMRVLISLMIDFKVIAKDDRFSSLTVDVPSYDSAWLSPKKAWLKDDVLSAGLYWSTAKEGERWHYEEFPKIFTNGSKVDPFYNNFKGYVDKSEDSAYRGKLIKNGAEKVLVKEFPATGRKIEIYLYSNLDSIKESNHSITISRGHAGEVGNNDYPGLPGTLRFASHCRSIDDSDQLIKANADSPIITITGTGRASETNPTLYYLLEYLGAEEKWGDWRSIKDYIRPHMPQSIEKYNFPSDDFSFIYAVMLQKLKSQKAQETPSLGTEIGIFGIWNLLKDFKNNLLDSSL